MADLFQYGPRGDIEDGAFSVVDFDAGSAQDFTFPPPGQLLRTRPVDAADHAAFATRLAELDASARSESIHDQLTGHRADLEVARELLLAYGTPEGEDFVTTMSAVRTPIVDYRDSGLTDPACDEHITWINARVNEINAFALYQAGVLR